MTTTTRSMLAGLAVIAIVLIGGGLLFDRHETRAHPGCMDGVMNVIGGTLTAPGAPEKPRPDPDVYTGNFYVVGCEDANRAGLIATGIGAAALTATAIIWWRRRSALIGHCAE